MKLYAVLEYTQDLTLDRTSFIRAASDEDFSALFSHNMRPDRAYTVITGDGRTEYPFLDREGKPLPKAHMAKMDGWGKPLEPKR